MTIYRQRIHVVCLGSILSLLGCQIYHGLNREFTASDSLSVECVLDAARHSPGVASVEQLTLSGPDRGAKYIQFMGSSGEGTAYIHFDLPNTPSGSIFVHNWRPNPSEPDAQQDELMYALIDIVIARVQDRCAVKITEVSRRRN